MKELYKQLLELTKQSTGPNGTSQQRTKGYIYFETQRMSVVSWRR